jgi:hypothetical protein
MRSAAPADLNGSTSEAPPFPGHATTLRQRWNRKSKTELIKVLWKSIPIGNFRVAHHLPAARNGAGESDA